MTKNEFLIKAVLSLNNGNTGYSDNRVNTALKQYDQLKEAGVTFEENDETLNIKED